MSYTADYHQRFRFADAGKVGEGHFGDILLFVAEDREGHLHPNKERFELQMLVEKGSRIHVLGFKDFNDCHWKMIDKLNLPKSEWRGKFTTIGKMVASCYMINDLFWLQPCDYASDISRQVAELRECFDRVENGYSIYARHQELLTGSGYNKEEVDEFNRNLEMKFHNGVITLEQCIQRKRTPTDKLVVLDDLSEKGKKLLKQSEAEGWCSLEQFLYHLKAQGKIANLNVVEKVIKESKAKSFVNKVLITLGLGVSAFYAFASML